MHKAFSIKESFRTGWHVFKKQWLLLGSSILLLGITDGMMRIGEPDAMVAAPVVLLAALRIVFLIFNLIVSIAIIKMALRLIDGKAVTLRSVLPTWRQAVYYAIATLLFSIVCALVTLPLALTAIIASTFIPSSIFLTIGIGLLVLALVMTLVFVSVTFMYYSFVIIDSDKGPIKALKESARITKKSRKLVFLWGLAAIGINILGFLALIVGLLVSMSITMVAFAYTYRKLHP
jgi:uncharacterized membrane protein